MLGCYHTVDSMEIRNERNVSHVTGTEITFCIVFVLQVKMTFFVI